MVKAGCRWGWGQIMRLVVGGGGGRLIVVMQEWGHACRQCQLVVVRGWSRQWRNSVTWSR